MTPNEDGQPLDRALAIAEELDATDVIEDLHAFAERLREGRFYVACVGQFKRGKSTLLNALIRDAILPVGVTPVTAVVTVVRYGVTRSARVRLHGKWRAIAPSLLAEVVAEERNPENAKGVEAVEVFTPSPLLASGMCLVDTPGIGSVFEGNTLATKEFVPHVDAALVVIGADPPVSGDELGLVAQLATHTSHLFFVLNKADRANDRERSEAAAFTKRQVERRLGSAVSRVYEVSALASLEGGDAGELAALEADLGALAEHAGAGLLADAERRAVARAARALERELEERRLALTRPLAESEARIVALQCAREEAERALGDLAALFASEEQRLSRAFEDARRGFLADATPHARRALSDRIEASTPGRPMRRNAMSAAQDIAEAAIAQWLTTAEPVGEALFRSAVGRFVALANTVLARVVDVANEPVELEHLRGSGFGVRRAYHFGEFMTLAEPSLLARTADAFRTASGKRAAVERSAQAFLDRLLEVNSARVANDLRDRVRESRRGVEAEIRRRLQATLALAERALANARRVQEGAGQLEEELRTLDGHAVALATLAASRSGRRGDPGG
jgi:hypothetical protein